MVRNINSDEDYIALEQVRIKTMITNIAANAFPLLKEEGVIILFAGVNHALRLAANFSQAYKDLKEYDITILPIKLFSPYVLDGIKSHRAAEHDTKKTDSPSILKLYQNIQYQEIISTDEKGSLITIELDKTLKKIHSHLQLKSHHDEKASQKFLTLKDWISLSLVSKRHYAMSKPEINKFKPKPIF